MPPKHRNRWRKRLFPIFQRFNVMNHVLIAPSDLLTRAWKLFATHWKELLKISLWGFLAIPILFIFIALFVYDHSFWPLLALGYLGIILLSGWIQVRLMQASLHIVDGKPPAPHEAKDAWAFAPGLIIWTISWSLPLIPLFFLFFVPALWLGVRWSFASFRFVESRKPYARGSAALVNGRWFPVFGRLLLPALIYTGVSSIFSFIFSFLNVFSGLLGANFSEGSMASVSTGYLITLGGVYSVTLLASMALGLCYSMYLMVYEALLYRSLEKTAKTHAP